MSMHPPSVVSPLRGLALMTLVAGCGAAASNNTQVPAWTSTTVDFGQGQFHLGVRYRWIVDRDRAGVTLRTPEGGTAQMRVFFCGKSRSVVQETIRQQLRGHLVGNEFSSHKHDVFSLRYWRGKTSGGTAVAAAIAMHGPLLISVSSTTFDIDDLVGIARRVSLTLPVATIQGCFPLCEADTGCTPSNPDEG